ncbi:serine/threonine protein kinase [Pseudogymnoascus sp. 23342-1-I1]|nr:serine/threonine protein kinase [Pseudogymnoascus sp. 23342-1-I1]
MEVTKVEKLELPLRMTWINDLSHGVAFLESLGFAHGDLRPENILLDRDRLKLADFDCTARLGSEFEACISPYGRILGSEGGVDKGTAGNLGPRTEQFALGSLYYLINYGFEVYGDRCLGDDPSGKEHGPTVVDLLQKMIFPELHGDPMIDSIIKKCWYGGYKTIGELAENTSRLCGPGNRASDAMSSDDLGSKRKLCEELVGLGILAGLGSNDPRQRGRPIERRWVSWEFLNT